MVLDPETDW